MQVAIHATVPSVRSFGRKTPLLLRVCGRRAAGTCGGGGDGVGEADGDAGVTGVTGEAGSIGEPEIPAAPAGDREPVHGEDGPCEIGRDGDLTWEGGASRITVEAGARPEEHEDVAVGAGPAAATGDSGPVAIGAGDVGATT